MVTMEAMAARLEAWTRRSRGALETFVVGETPANSYCWHDPRMRLGRQWAWDARRERLLGVVQFTEASQGGPKATHGGAVELIMDVASELVRSKVDDRARRSSITVRYLNLTPIDTPLLVEAYRSRARILYPVESEAMLDEEDGGEGGVLTCARADYRLSPLQDGSQPARAPGSEPERETRWREGSELDAAVAYASEDGELEADEILPYIGEYPKFEFPPDSLGGAKILSRCFKRTTTLPVLSRAVLFFGEKCGADSKSSPDSINASAIYVALDQLAGRATRLCINEGRPVTAEMTVDLALPATLSLPALCIAEAEAKKTQSPSGKVVINVTSKLLSWPDRLEIATSRGRFMQVGWDHMPKL